MIALKVPPLGESIVEATVSRWVKQQGEAVNSGDTVLELDTDKITVEVPALRAGVLVKQAVKEGDVVHVDDVLGEIDETATAAAAPTAPAARPAAPSAPAPAAAPQPAPAAPPSPPTAPAATGGPQKSSPAARQVAEARGVDIGAVQGTGRGGVVSKPDVLAVQPQAQAIQPATQPPTQPAAPSGPPALRSAPTPLSPGERETREKLSTRRKRIAENLLQSHLATAHLTTFNEIDMSAVSSLRERVKEKIEKQYGVRLSFMPFFVRAACIALRDYPVVNAQLDGDEIIYKNYVNMGIAVASEQGLVVPNIKDADRKGLLEISRDITAVAKKARDVKLTMDDLTGGSFTITNGGVFGSLVSTPIINYPQVGILGLHKIQDRPVAIDGKVEIRPMMYVALSYDHRIIDGQAAVLFLVRVKELMEDPATMLIE
ncbi:MAG TPA: 2-oxoglutarate dehydrogenase complex dihydrolipoyllysine-residue succinyltransferase [Gemmatimonadaceae bacterium]|nr:2-oxoglutarate dehydrogenase complex dihydrolipoyllysine-residue succinyltransferase [Gemmatimonadaceae bacterium]